MVAEEVEFRITCGPDMCLRYMRMCCMRVGMHAIMEGDCLLHHGINVPISSDNSPASCCLVMRGSGD